MMGSVRAADNVEGDGCVKASLAAPNTAYSENESLLVVEDSNAIILEEAKVCAHQNRNFETDNKVCSDVSLGKRIIEEAVAAIRDGDSEKSDSCKSTSPTANQSDIGEDIRNKGSLQLDCATQSKINDCEADFDQDNTGSNNDINNINSSALSTCLASVTNIPDPSDSILSDHASKSNYAKPNSDRLSNEKETNFGIEPSKRPLCSGSLSSTACNSTANSRRASSCSPYGVDGGSQSGEHLRKLAKRRHVETMHFKTEKETSEDSAVCDDGIILKNKESGLVGIENEDSTTNPTSPYYYDEAEQEREGEIGSPVSDISGAQNASTSVRGPLGYYSVSEAPYTGTNSTCQYPIVRGVSRDNTKKRWAVYWKGYRRYFYDKFFSSCLEAYRRAVQFRQQATSNGTNGASLNSVISDLSGASITTRVSPQLPQRNNSYNCKIPLRNTPDTQKRQKQNNRINSIAFLNSSYREEDLDRSIMSLYKEAILFVLEDLRNNVLTQFLATRTSSSTLPPGGDSAAVEIAAAATAQRLLDQLLLVHAHMVSTATSAAELEPSLMIVSPCLEELKLPSQQNPQQQLIILQSILAMHIQQLLLLSRYLNKGGPPTDGDIKHEPHQSLSTLKTSCRPRI